MIPRIAKLRIITVLLRSRLTRHGGLCNDFFIIKLKLGLDLIQALFRKLLKDKSNLKFKPSVSRLHENLYF